MTGRGTVDLGPAEAQVEIRRRPTAQERRRRAAEKLFAELKALPHEKRRVRLREERFLNQILFELLFEAGQAALPADSARASELATLAGELGLMLAERAGFDPELRGEKIARAFCLEGTALRLLGKTRDAEAAFRLAGINAHSSPTRGFFCRSLAMLRWDEAQTEEATALLHQARRRYAEGPASTNEVAVCRALLGLLLLEEGLPWKAEPILLQASPDLDPEAQPRLTAQLRLGLAFCCAFAHRRKEAQSFREAARTLYPQLREEESFSMAWMEGQVAAVSRDHEEAERLLDSVRRAQIARGCLPEATMASIELGLVWVETGRQGEVETLAEELRTAFNDSPGLEFAIGTLESLAVEGRSGLVERDLWSYPSFPLRITFRSQGAFFQPVPFV